MKFNRHKFFEGFRERIDPTIEQEQVDGLEFLLGQMESDPFWKYIPQIAYTLATVYHETAGSFQPVEEGYYLGSAARVKRFQKTLRYYPYYGRGYVQLTWKRNYEKAAKALGGGLVDLVTKPELALKPQGAYLTMTYGMHQGWFTGKKLDDYIKGTKKDYTNARKIINGLDKAGLIAGYARAFEKILNESVSSKLVPGAETFNSDLDSAAIGQQTAEASSPKLVTLGDLHDQTETIAADNQSEVTAKTEKETPAGTQSVEVKTVNEQDVNTPANVTSPEPYQGVGFWGVIKRDLAAATGGNLSFSALSEYAQQASGWPEWVIGLIGKAAIGALILTGGYFIFRVVHYFVDTWKKNQKVKYEADAATSTVRKDISWQ